MTIDFADIAALAPLLVLVGMGCLVLLAETFVRGTSRSGLLWLTVAGCVLTAAALVGQWGSERTLVFQEMWVVDRLSLFLDFAFVATALVTALLSDAFMREHGFEFGEFYALILFATAGMVMVVHANHLLTLLIGIESMSIAAYVLTGCWRRSPRSSEGALKYFLMGAFATSFLVYGMALIYGTTGGELGFGGIAAKARGAAESSGLFLVGVYLVIIALIFKVAAVPFHFWAPDAYEGAPTPVSGFMAAGVKAAAFGGIVRVLGTVFGGEGTTDAIGWVPVISIVAFLTMTFGNLAALRQENVKRLLAYSSVAHAGYLLIGVVALGLGVQTAEPAILFYLVAYTFTTLGTFGVVAWVGRRGDERLFIDDWAGTGAARPGLGLAMTIFLLSLGGVPPTAGFFGKLYLFRAAMERPELYWLVVAGVLNSVISIYYYLRIVVAMYFRDPLRPHQWYPSGAMRLALVITAVATVGLGLFPGAVVDWAGGAGAAVAKVALAPLR